MRYSLATHLALATSCALVVACGKVDTDIDGPVDASTSDVGDAATDGGSSDAGTDAGGVVPTVPLANAPWPKFRGNALQTGATTARLSDDGRAFWSFPTGKGIFSSPVVGADGTIYVGSASRSFYAINDDGTERWSFETGEIIDSAALLDDLGRVYFGSGDGTLYALDARSGDEIWRFNAEDPGETGAIINWFEGNVAMGSDGTLYVPNDNFRVYAVPRDATPDESGVVGYTWAAEMPDQTWSSPAVDPATGELYWGNNDLFGLVLGEAAQGSVYSYAADGTRQWSATTRSTVAASPLVTGDAIILGSYDGYVRSFSRLDGSENWAFATREHVYASAALHPDGFVVVPSADGTIYALSLDDGTARWAFDWDAPIRSSPAIDGDGNIYVGAGDGYLLVLNGQGALRWAVKLIDDDRDDLNASPALGEHAIYIAGESGEVFGVPFDFCLRDGDEIAAARCRFGGEPAPADEVAVLYTTEFGTPLDVAPARLDPNHPLAFSLRVRSGGETVLAAIDRSTLEFSSDPAVPVDVILSGNRQFVTVVAPDGFEPDNGVVSMRLTGEYLVDLEREGLALSGGTPGDRFDAQFSFALTEPGSTYTLRTPNAGGAPASTWVMRRLAVPLPTLLPSYNQIGFDSLYFVVGLVSAEYETVGGPATGLMWVAAGVPDANGSVRPVPGTRGMFPFAYRYEKGLLTAVNRGGASLQIMNFDLAFEEFYAAGALAANGAIDGPLALRARLTCADLGFYASGVRALGLCDEDAGDTLVAYGAAMFEPLNDGRGVWAPADVGDVTWTFGDDQIVATINGGSASADDHAFGILVADTDTGEPLTLAYGTGVRWTPVSGEPVTSVTLPVPADGRPDRFRAYLMVDTYPMSSFSFDLTPTP